MLLDVHYHVEVTLPTAEFTCFSFSRDSKSGAGVDACWNLDLESLFTFNPTLASTVAAGVSDYAPGAAAGRA
jgi:hypothetical protein